MQSERHTPAWCPAIEAGIAVASAEHVDLPAPIVEDLRPVDLARAMDVVEDLAADLELKEVAARNRISQADVESIARTCCQTLPTVLGNDRASSDGVPDLHAVRLELIRQKATLRAARQRKYAPIRHWIERELRSAAGKDLLNGAVEECRSIVKDTHLSAERWSACGSNVNLLRAVALPKRRLLITHAIPAASLPQELLLLGWTLVADNGVRRGRPRVRLHICSVDAKGATDSARSMTGYFGLLAMAKAWLVLLEGRS